MRWKPPTSAERDPVYNDQDRQRMLAEFDAWMGQMGSLIAELKAYVPDTVAVQLDGSIESLLPLEAWLLEKFDTHTDLIADQDGRTMELLHPYLAKTLEEASGGKLRMGLDDKMGDFALPVIWFPKGNPILFASVGTKATAAVHRKRKTMLYDIARQWEALAAKDSTMRNPEDIPTATDLFDTMLDAAIAEEEAKDAKRRG